MEKETFILQTTRTGRLPTNAVFTDEGAARTETEKAERSNAFEYIKLVHLVGSQKKTLIEIGAPGGVQATASRARAAKSPGIPAKKHVSTAQLIGRLSTLITALLIGVVLFYAAQYALTR
jgi:hypothetical protein